MCGAAWLLEAEFLSRSDLFASKVTIFSPAVSLLPPSSLCSHLSTIFGPQSRSKTKHTSVQYGPAVRPFEPTSKKINFAAAQQHITQRLRAQAARDREVGSFFTSFIAVLQLTLNATFGGLCKRASARFRLASLPRENMQIFANCHLQIKPPSLHLYFFIIPFHCVTRGTEGSKDI